MFYINVLTLFSAYQYTKHDFVLTKYYYLMFKLLRTITSLKQSINTNLENYINNIDINVKRVHRP